MKDNMMYPLLVGICLMAIGSSAKAILDVAVLKAENKNSKELLHEIRKDVKEMRKYLVKE